MLSAEYFTEHAKQQYRRFVVNDAFNGVIIVITKKTCISLKTKSISYYFHCKLHNNIALVFLCNKKDIQNLITFRIHHISV